MLGGGTLAVIWGTWQATSPPDTAPMPGSEEEGARAQQKIFAIVRGVTASKPRSERVVREYTLSEGEINAFLSRHLGTVAGMPFDRLAVRLVGGGVIEVFGRVPLRRVLGEEAAGWNDYLPESWRTADLTVWLRGPVRLETETSPGQPKALRLEVSEAHVGRQRVPVTAFEWMLGPDGQRLFTRLRLPSSVEAVTIERQRAIVRTAS
jgi:hypothetical protein